MQAEMYKITVWYIRDDGRGESTVMLKVCDVDTVIPLFLEKPDALAILSGSHAPIHFSLYDALIATGESSGLHLLTVEITGEHTAQILFLSDESGEVVPVMLDPADALALAHISGCEVYVSRSIMEEIGIPANLVLDEYTVSMQNFTGK
ncbi:hypothetical protein FACS1894172_09930 [Spirochaetia bacterium]|nr:hypothetical protein FACS1894164_08410 [Spirochaetia bacterium]GHU32747.1 hypothetical protein FACS1894172_09930 [Spirochaetia bacterium]